MFIERELPPLDPAAEHVSRQLTEKLREAIDASSGALPFSEFMRIALYEPGLGYYLAGAEKFGPSGDFVTAPDVSPLFGYAIANHCSTFLRNFTDPEIFEFSAGSGALAASLLEAFESSACMPVRYSILELSPELRERQRALLAERVPQLLDRVQWVSAPPQSPIRGVVIANEVLDAIPFDTYTINGDVLKERRVSCLHNVGFEWCETEPSPAMIAWTKNQWRQEPATSVQAYRFEVCSAIDSWVADVSRLLSQGQALVFDYGYPRSELYNERFSEGTLRCFYQHAVHDDPFILIGAQDITASVDFTRVAEAAVTSGMGVAGFADQANFLIASGIVELLEAKRAVSVQESVLKLTEQVKTLLLPQKMGTQFKVMALNKHMDTPSIGFSLRDDRRYL